MINPIHNTIYSISNKLNNVLCNILNGLDYNLHDFFDNLGYKFSTRCQCITKVFKHNELLTIRTCT